MAQAQENKEESPEALTTENSGPEFFEDEKHSFSLLFFLTSGALLFVTLWTFWDDEYSRRGFKDYQEEYFKVQYQRADDELTKINAEIGQKEQALLAKLEETNISLAGQGDYQSLVEKARLAKIRFDEETEIRKFTGSRLDEYYYYYKKAQHEGHNFDVELARVKNTEVELADQTLVVEKYQKLYEEAEDKVLERKASQVKLEKELLKLTNDRSGEIRKKDFYQPFPFFWRPAEILQTVIPGYGKNNFAEITYKVDRCQTCHIAFQDDYYKDFEQPLKSHPNIDLYIKKHPVEQTGCTWCHKGQGTATAPAEDAHGSHHETDQSIGINEMILRGDQMQSNCVACHNNVMDLEGAPLLSKGRRLFTKLGCHGCHLADGFVTLGKVGPRLNRIAAKVNPTWLFKWIKNPKEYLPKTRMPDFDLNNKEAVAITAYLMAASEKGYKLSAKYKGGNPENGQKLFESVGCLACHKLKGKGEEFAPSLNRIANKVNPDWLVTWISNPKSYNHKSKMPDLRLTEEQGSDLAAYLIQFGKPKRIKNIDALIGVPETIALGEKLVRRRGCFACHDIPGMEKEGRIAPELSNFGIKQVMSLEFGDSHVAKTWESWTRHKIKNPQTYKTERILDKMPNFNLKDDEIDALVVLLKGFSGAKIPHQYKKNLTKKEKIVETGRRLVERYNCRGCHHVEGEGGIIQKYISAKAKYPPPLELGDYHVGERIKGAWLYSFLKNPTPVRTWLKVKMPTFFFTDEQVRDLTAYFEALAPGKPAYDEGINVKKDKVNVETGVKIVNYMDCGKCHDDGAKGIEFSIASERLREDWIPKWLKNTREMIPWTKMPNHWPKENGEYTIQTKFNLLKGVDGGNVDKSVGYIGDYMIAHNTAEYDDSLNLGGGEEEEEEEDEEESDDEEGEEGDEDF